MTVMGGSAYLAAILVERRVLYCLPARNVMGGLQ